MVLLEQREGHQVSIASSIPPLGNSATLEFGGLALASTHPSGGDYAHVGTEAAGPWDGSHGGVVAAHR